MQTSSLKSGNNGDALPRTAQAGWISVLGVVLLSACVSSSPAASTIGESAIPSASDSAAPSQARPDVAGRIVFLRFGLSYGEGTVFTANADGTNEHQISSLGEGCCIWATRNGERVLFSNLAPDGRITTATMNFDGSDKFVIPLLDDTLNLSPGPFSPDGKQIAFEGFLEEAQPRTQGIFIGNVDGTRLVQITHDVDIAGDWSPDGTQVLFLRDPDAETPGPNGLFTVNVDGSGEHRVTPDDVDVPCCWGYRWSPDGSRILFPDEDGVLWVINPDGTDLIRLFVDEKVFHVRRSVITPTWSPDGTQVMFGLGPSASPFDPSPNGLYVIDADGTGLTLVIGTGDSKREPTWVP